MDGQKASIVVAAGLITAVIGGILFGLAHAYDTEPWVLLAAYGLLGIGGIIFVAGFGLLVYALRDPIGVHEQDAVASFTALVRCMVAMSIADERLDDDEVDTICEIYETLTGSELDRDFVIDIAETMAADGADIRTELLRVNSILTTDMKEKIIRASFFILAADGIIEKAEEELLDNIRKGLEFPKMRYLKLKQEFLAEHGNDLEAGQADSS
jgi:tellurite resistance protein